MRDEHGVTVPCPRCSFGSRRDVGWLKVNDRLQCDACQEPILLDRTRFFIRLREEEIADVFRQAAMDVAGPVRE